MKMKRNKIENGNAVVRISKCQWFGSGGLNDDYFKVTIQCKYNNSDYYRRLTLGVCAGSGVGDKAKEIVFSAIEKSINECPQSFSDEKQWIKFVDSIYSCFTYNDANWIIG